MLSTQYQFDNEVTLNNEAIPFTIIKQDNKEYHYVYGYGNQRFQCRELKKAISQLDSELLYSISQRDKKNNSYYGKFIRHFDIEEHRFYLMKLFFTNGDKLWNHWAIPEKYCKRINWITHDFDDRS